jgi:NitT/TauT family transport system permease protein
MAEAELATHSVGAEDARVSVKRSSTRLPSWIWPLLGVVIVASLWEVVGRVFIRSQFLFAPLSTTLIAFWTLLWSGELARHLLVSAQELLVGYLLAVLVGISTGAAFAVLPLLSRTFTPIVLAAYVTPLIAITPLIIMLAGLGMASKVVIVFLLAVFPILINTETGLRAVDPDYVETARAFRATRLQTLRMVIFPAALVYIVTGLRLAIGRGIIGVVVGELFGASEGIGFLIVQFSNSFRTAQVLALVLLLAIIGVSANAILEAFERRLSPWRRETRQ